MKNYLIPIVCCAAVAAQQIPPVDFTCPMDPNVRSKGPGKCPICGMKLEARIQEPIEYRLGFRTKPAAPLPGKPVELVFELIDPRDGVRATKFEWMHEKLFHLFLVSEDLEFFVHTHPELHADGTFHLATTLPRPGSYKLLADCYPTGGTPQLLPRFFSTAGAGGSIVASTVHPSADLATKKTENLSVSLRMDPPSPIPGTKTMLFFDLSPVEGVEPYLGAMGHMLAVSNDLIDSIHEHPFLTSELGGGKQVQFNIFFPREATYRVWVQFQRNGVVNTAQFTIPVKSP